MSRQQKKTKFRRQDPFYKGPGEAGPVGRDRPPGKDEDVIDVPEVRGGASMFGPGLAEEVLYAKPPKPSKAAVEEGLSARAKRRLRAKEKRRVAAEGGGTGAAGSGKKRRLPDGASADRQKQAPSAASLPKQRPGESARSYKRRVDAALASHLAASRRKMVTDHKREKRKQRADIRKGKKAHKRPGDEEEGEEEGEEEPPDATLGRTELPVFGDVVERPPILGAEAMKSRSKLKKEKEAASGQKAAGTADTANRVQAASDLADYAARVREAYAEIKKRRLASKGKS